MQLCGQPKHVNFQANPYNEQEQKKPENEKETVKSTGVNKCKSQQKTRAILPIPQWNPHLPADYWQRNAAPGLYTAIFLHGRNPAKLLSLAEEKQKTAEVMG